MDKIESSEDDAWVALMTELSKTLHTTGGSVNYRKFLGAHELKEHDKLLDHWRTYDKMAIQEERQAAGLEGEVVINASDQDKYLIAKLVEVFDAVSQEKTVSL
ncbi:unnamed protein product [Amoebophrya sp. A120]|nr:unnamed protein product [Amoebophrya sp. A120]